MLRMCCQFLFHNISLSLSLRKWREKNELINISIFDFSHFPFFLSFVRVRGADGSTVGLGALPRLNMAGVLEQKDLAAILRFRAQLAADIRA